MAGRWDLGRIWLIFWGQNGVFWGKMECFGPEILLFWIQNLVFYGGFTRGSAVTTPWGRGAIVRYSIMPDQCFLCLIILNHAGSVFSVLDHTQSCRISVFCAQSYWISVFCTGSVFSVLNHTGSVFSVLNHTGSVFSVFNRTRIHTVLSQGSLAHRSPHWVDTCVCVYVCMCL